MITMRTVLAHTLAGAALIALSLMAQAQSVTPAQQDAIRAQCRSDFMANCSGVPRGGREAFTCLQQNKAKLSGGCKSAIEAVSAAAAPKPAAPTVEAKPQPAPAPAAMPASTAAAPAEKSAPVVTAPAKPSAAKPVTKPVTAPKAAATPVRPVAPPPAAPASPAAVSPPAAAAPKHQTTLGEAVMIRRFCSKDYRVLCKDTQIGGGRAIKCLADNGPALSPDCKAAIAKAGN